MSRIERTGQAQTVKPGDRIRARDWNAIVRRLDSVADAFRTTHAGNALQGKARGVIVTAENVGETDISEFAVVAIVGQAYGAEPPAQRDIALQVREPEEGDAAAHWGVSVEPILTGTSGRVCVSGVAWVWCDEETSGVMAGLVEGTQAAALGTDGRADVLATFAPDGGGLLALVRLPSGGGGGDDGDSILIYNPHYDEIPKGGIFRYTGSTSYSGYDFVARDFEPGALPGDQTSWFRRMTGGHSDLAVALQAIPKLSAGRCAVSGVCEVLVIPSASIDLALYGQQTAYYTAHARVGRRYDVGTTTFRTYPVGEEGPGIRTGQPWDFHVNHFELGPLVCLAAPGYPFIRARFAGRIS